MVFTMKPQLYVFSIGIMCAMLPSAVPSAIPMWEYLSRSEKMGHLFNMFVQQVEKHCSNNPEPDCSKLLLVYGLTNLAKMGDESLDDMDPYQRNANEIVWDSMMKGKHEQPKPILSEADDLVQGAASTIEEENTGNENPQSFLLGPMVVRVLPNGLPIPGEKNDLPKDEDVEEFAPKQPATTAESSTATPTTNSISRRFDSSFDGRYRYPQYSSYT